MTARKGYCLGRVLADEPVGLREVQDGLWLVPFAKLDLGHIDLRKHAFLPNKAFDLNDLAS